MSLIKNIKNIKNLSAKEKDMLMREIHKKGEEKFPTIWIPNYSKSYDANEENRKKWENTYIEGYTDGYADSSEVERIPSDSMFQKIIMLLSNKNYLKTDNYSEIIEYLKNQLYNE